MPDNLTDYEENRLLDLSVVVGDYVALLTVPGTDSTAGTEVTGGSYARAAASFAAAASGSKATNSPHLFLNMPSCEVLGWEIRSAVTAGNRKWHGLFSTMTVAAANSGDLLTLAAHGLVDGQKVVFQDGFTPAGLTANTRYYVVSATTNTFQVSATLAGAAVAITADMAAASMGLVATVNAAEVFAIPSGSLVLSLS
jgi:hypothetical protein